MPLYTDVIIIYNPKSTGSSHELAQTLQAELGVAAPNLPVSLVPTQRRRHAPELAEVAATKSKYVLVVSASGDGGYHEVVEGVMRARANGHDATAGLLPAGNANDHWHNLSQGELITQIVGGRRQWIDLLEIQMDGPGGMLNRYAHSYAGIGLTPSVGRELNKHRLNRWNEAFIVLYSFLRIRPVTVIVDGRRTRYDNLIFSNVGLMSKYLRLAATAKATDGKFEVTNYRTRNKLGLLLQIVRAVAGRLKEPLQTDRFRFETVRRTEMQLDGEIISLPDKTKVTIAIAPSALPCVL